MPSSPTPRRSAANRGQNLVEFALLFPVLMLVLAGVFDLARIFQVAITVTNAAREAARYALDYPGDTAGIRAQVVAEGTGNWVDLADTTRTQIDVTCPQTCGSGLPLRVVVTYRLDLILPGVLGLGNVPVRSGAEMMLP